MSPLRAIARPLLAATFVFDGLDAIYHADEQQERAQPFQPLLDRVGEKVKGLPTDPATVTRIIGAVQVTAGVMLAYGKAPRASAATLALVTLPSILTKKPIGAKDAAADPGEHRAALLRAAALIGGLIFAAEDRQGKPSLGYRYDSWKGQRAELDAIQTAHRDELAELKTTMKDKVKAAKNAG